MPSSDAPQRGHPASLTGAPFERARLSRESRDRLPRRRVADSSARSVCVASRRDGRRALVGAGAAPGPSFTTSSVTTRSCRQGRNYSPRFVRRGGWPHGPSQRGPACQRGRASLRTVAALGSANVPPGHRSLQRLGRARQQNDPRLALVASVRRSSARFGRARIDKAGLEGFPLPSLSVLAEVVRVVSPARTPLSIPP